MMRWNPPPRASIGGYDILCQLRRGGMGEILLARQRGARGFERLAAIKTLQPDIQDEEALRVMFLDEAKITAQLDHPTVVRVFDFGEDDGLLYMVLEYVAGESFAALVRRRPPPQVVAMAMATVCHGLHAAHELVDTTGAHLGLIHRDVSPANLMLTFDGHVKILDFGIAWMRGRETPQTAYGVIKGKPPYMAPEQLRNERFDRRIDVFAAAVVTHELLTGRRLFAGDSPLAVLRAIEHDEIAPPSLRVPDLPAGFDAVVMRGLERNPDARYPTALDMAEALDELARATGADKLESYARRELAGPREHHRRAIAKLLAGNSADGDASGVSGADGRPTRVGTVPLIDLGADDAVSPHAPTLPATPASSEPVGAPRRTRRRGAIASRVLLVSLVVAAASWVLVRGLAPVTPMKDTDGVELVRAYRASGELTATARLGSRDGGAGDTVARATAVARPRESLRDAATREASTSTSQVTPPSHPRRRAASRITPARRRSAPAKLSRTRAPVSPGAHGYLTVGASPYALVRLDGRDVGPTPIMRRHVPAGPHTVVLTNPHNGTERLRREITVDPGEHEVVLDR